MRWELAEEQEMFRDSFQEWLARFAPTEAVHEWLDEGDVAPFEDRLIAQGWLGVGVPEECGGQGGGLLELALAAEQLGRSAAPSSAWMASVLAAPALVAAPGLARSVLEEGGFAALVVNSDKPADLVGPVRATRGDVLSGGVRSVLGADRAGQLIVPAQTAAGCELFVVRAGASGVEISGRKLLDRSRSVADVVLTDVPASKLEVDSGLLLAQAALRAAVLVAADSLGASGRMLDLAVDYSKQRRQFGVPIGSFQAMKHAAAEMLVSVESSRSIVYFAAETVEQDHEDAALHAATAKAQVTTAGERAADSALTMHGAIGYTWEHDLHLFYKRAKLNKHLFGTPSAWNERLASVLPLVPSA